MWKRTGNFSSILQFCKFALVRKIFLTYFTLFASNFRFQRLFITYLFNRCWDVATDSQSLVSICNNLFSITFVMKFHWRADFYKMTFPESFSTFFSNHLHLYQKRFLLQWSYLLNHRLFAWRIKKISFPSVNKNHKSLQNIKNCKGNEACQSSDKSGLFYK